MGILADNIGSIFSRTQLEDVLDKNKAGATIRWFCKPFLLHGAALSCSCSLFSITVTGAYFAWGVIRLDGIWKISQLTLAVILLAAMLLLAVPLKMLAREKTEELLVLLSPLLWILTLPLRPVAALMIIIEDKIIGSFRHQDEAEEEDRDEIIAAVTDGKHQGVVEEEEREMIVNIFDLKNSDLSDIMTPRTDICAVAIDTPLDEAIQLSNDKGFSRVPVFEETRDNIKGVFYVKDALNLWGKHPESQPKLSELMRPPYFVPETKNVADLMRELQEKKMHLAVVLDEYGGTAGLVSIEDVVEEIVGEIQDEYDPEEDVLLRKLAAGHFDADARTHVHDMNEALEYKVIPEDEDYETLGGFILDQLGHIPAPRESLVWESVRFSIRSSDERKIGRVRVEVIPHEEAEGEKEQVGPDKTTG
ncbi:MAG: HlyC/CorC family transporter [Planctomycetes bacterium]|nr:HlyC/CorC family transporter [Planctomycetota bacterium]